MNNKGQSLVLFVLFLPLIVMFVALLFNASIAYYNKIKIIGSIESNLKVVLENDIQDELKIKNVLIKNLPNNEYVIKIDDNKIYLKVNAKDNYVFDNFMPLNNQKEYNYCGDYDTNVFYQNEECL